MMLTRAVLILASEDNLLGVDANPKTPAHLQPLRQIVATPGEAFEEALKDMDSDGCKAIASNPLSLVSLYSNALVSAFAAHVELYQRYWDIKFEPFANTSAVYGYATHRDAARHFSMELSTQLRYLNHTIDGLQHIMHSEPGLKELYQDFEHFAREVSTLKQQSNQFLEQQVTKLALQDTRIQMQEARDLKRITYLAFVFVPLSLISSFFGMNVKELDSGSTPVWVFAVTAIATLACATFVAWFAGSHTRKTMEEAFWLRYGRVQTRFVKVTEGESPDQMPTWMKRVPRTDEKGEAGPVSIQEDL